jgi:hypothetical protein
VFQIGRESNKNLELTASLSRFLHLAKVKMYSGSARNAPTRPPIGTKLRPKMVLYCVCLDNKESILVTIENILFAVTERRNSVIHR